MLIIFDFDGTIVDSKQVYYKAMSRHLLAYGFGKEDVDKAIDVGLSVAETLKKLGFSFFARWFLKREIMKDVLKHAEKIKKCRDVYAIKEIKARKILVSNSLKEFVFPVLKRLKLEKEFDEVYTADDFDDKEEFIKNYFRENKINRKKVYYIGDRAADVKLAREVGIKSIIVAGKCAWDSRKEILREKPDFVLDDLAEIKELIFD